MVGAGKNSGSRDCSGRGSEAFGLLTWMVVGFRGSEGFGLRDWECLGLHGLALRTSGLWVWGLGVGSSGQLIDAFRSLNSVSRISHFSENTTATI